MNNLNDSFDYFSSSDSIDIAFPEKPTYVIGPQKALDEIRSALKSIDGYRDDRVHFFKTVIMPLVPDDIQAIIEKLQLDKLSISYDSIIYKAGNLLSLFVAFGLDEYIDSIKNNQRFILLPFLELKLKKKIIELKKDKPFGWKIACKFYQKNMDSLSPLIDNLINLITLAWEFCPAIGEPEMKTGFYNRFVFTSNGGFVDLGHFFNCSIISYLYGNEEAIKRGENTEIGQRWLREKKWLVKLREKRVLVDPANT